MAGATEVSPRERRFAVVFSLVTAAAVAAPLVYGQDDFPLSNYPMFSHARPEVARIYHVVGYSNAGNHRPVSPEAVGTDEIMQAYQTVKLAIKRGPAEAQVFCEQTARFVATDSDYDDLEFLEVRVDWFDTVKYWKGERKPQRTRVVARCPVARSESG
jgi:hypothetical protein